jgi:4-hydroxybenzoate polyprenyltransferase
MKLLKSIFLFLNIKNREFVLQPAHTEESLSLLEHLFKPSIKVHNFPPLPPPNNKNKFESVLELIRVDHIPPTLFLSFSSALIVNPSLTTLLQPSFLVSTLDIVLLMSASMVINNIYDVETDKINKPYSPIVSGKITKREAVGIATLLLVTSEYFSINFLSENLQSIIHLTILYINLYTPVFKKIIFIKNLSCAVPVTFSLFFTALTCSKYPLMMNPNLDLLIVACNLVFTGSLSNEILLDIRDYIGDKKTNIKTLPIVFGKENAWNTSLFILYAGLLVNIVKLYQVTNMSLAGLFVLIMIPQVNELYNIKKTSFSDNSIEKYMDQSNKTLFIILLVLSSIHLFHL